MFSLSLFNSSSDPKFVPSSSTSNSNIDNDQFSKNLQMLYQEGGNKTTATLIPSAITKTTVGLSNDISVSTSNEKYTDLTSLDYLNDNNISPQKSNNNMNNDNSLSAMFNSSNSGTHRNLIDNLEKIKSDLRNYQKRFSYGDSVHNNPIMFQSQFNTGEVDLYNSEYEVPSYNNLDHSIMKTTSLTSGTTKSSDVTSSSHDENDRSLITQFTELELNSEDEKTFHEKREPNNNNNNNNASPRRVSFQEDEKDDCNTDNARVKFGHSSSFNNGSNYEYVSSIEGAVLIPWGKFKGVIDDRGCRCHYDHLNTYSSVKNCYCEYLPIVPSRLKTSFTTDDIIAAEKEQYNKRLAKRRSFINLSSRYTNDNINQENNSSTFSGDSKIINGHESLRKKLILHYRELNTLKFKRNLIKSSSSNKDTDVV